MRSFPALILPSLVALMICPTACGSPEGADGQGGEESGGSGGGEQGGAAGDETGTGGTSGNEAGSDGQAQAGAQGSGGQTQAGAQGSGGVNTGGAGSGGARTGGSGTGGMAAGGTGGQIQASLLPCGDVVPNLDHQPFDAIKKLRAGNEEVRILVYGQSISEQDWWKELRAWLGQTYPMGKLVMESHARGGCASQCLIGEGAWFVDNLTQNRLPGDVYAWKPDLILFHVYGSQTAYEKIVQGFKSNTTAQVLLQTDHRTQDDPNATSGERWSATMSTQYIPGFAKTYGFSLARIWEGWWAYMKANNQSAKVFLADEVHLNAEGNKLMARLLKPHLCYNPKTP